MKSTPTNNIGAPIWMNEEEDEEVNLSRNPSKSATSSSSTYEQGSLSQHGCTTKGFIYISFRFIAISLSLLMAATAILGLSMISGVDQSGRVFVGIYMFFFASLLFIFELNQIRQFESIDHMFKRNFGFMYSTSGNALFIIFIAFLSFGLGEPQTLCYSTGILLAIFGVIKFGVYLQYPELLE